MYNPDFDFYVPRTKRQLVEWLEGYYKHQIKVSYMSKAQLYAIFFKIRKRITEGRTHAKT